MRRLAPLVLILTAGCQAIGAPGAPLLAIPAAVEGVALRAFGRTLGDSVVSLVTGEDCSIARIGRGEAYCGRDDPPAPPPLCTRSLGAVDCWTFPPAGYPAYRGVADGPATLTEAQENNRIGWTGRIARAVRPAQAPELAPPPLPVIEPGPGTPVAPTLPTVAGEAAQRALGARPLPGGAQPDDRPVAPLLVPAEGGDGRGDVRRLPEP